METFIKKLFFENFYRKFFSVLAAFIIWTVVSNSIITTRVFQRVPVQIVNLASDKTVRGIMPNGFLDRRMAITLTGSKAVIDRMGSDDLEVIIDATGKKSDWVVQVSKKNLVSLNPDIELMKAVSQVSHSELIIHLCRFVTERIPVYISSPLGVAPEGYDFLDVWPQRLFHIISGPEDDVRLLQEEGVQLVFDLSSITKEDLDALRENDPLKDEIGYTVPDLWKVIRIPYLNNAAQSLHCPESSEVQINFLFDELLPIEANIPIRLFRPDGHAQDVSFKIRPEGVVKESNGKHFYRGRLFAANVSRLFLETVKDYMQIVILPSNKGSTAFCWEPQFIAKGYLEDAYVKKALVNGEIHSSIEKSSRASRLQQEEYHRARFQEYMRKFQLYHEKNAPLSLIVTSGPEGLTVREP